MVAKSQTALHRNANRRVAIVLQGVIAAGLALEVYERHWLNVVVFAGILMLTMLPAILFRQTQILIPPEFELLTIAFIFAAPSSAKLAITTAGSGGGIWHFIRHRAASWAILGWLLVYVLNENPRIEMEMRPGFVAFFAFCFSIAVGSVWELFEFAMDRVFGMNMQKPMFGDPSGLTDTMWDMTVNRLGAVAVSAVGYRYMKRGSESIVREVDSTIHRCQSEAVLAAVAR